MFNMNPNANRDALLTKWQEAKNALDAAKAIEADLRREVMETLYNFDENELREGTENIELGNGYIAKAVFKTSYKLTNDVDAMLDKLETTSEEGKFIADRLVKFKPELSVTEYKNLPANLRSIVNMAVVTKPAIPSFEIVAPKAKK
ncbi:hypothetical protein KJBENDCP_00051 [Klebsiella phage vB_KmiS-Kmi2C]|nr:hypothetical protein KJBENDCP_00051 [Klebsiella phage vB_KmiS-Kmi2C]